MRVVNNVFMKKVFKVKRAEVVFGDEALFGIHGGIPHGWRGCGSLGLY
jgi:hypothetical protein